MSFLWGVDATKSGPITEGLGYLNQQGEVSPTEGPGEAHQVFQVRAGVAYGAALHGRTLTKGEPHALQATVASMASTFGRLQVQL